MRMYGKYLALTSALSLAASIASAQVQIVTTTTAPADAMQFPVPGRQTKTGTAQIRGRVLAAETGNPIRRAQVRISGPDIVPKASLTDAEGRFEFRDLPAGRFTINATKSGYVSVQYGQTRPYESGRPIELADKQIVANADISMPRGSAISGRILDEFGEPMPDVAVTALRQSWSGGRRRLTPVGGRVGQTNDLGQFRLYGLPPGEYYVSATLRNGMEFMAIEMLVADRAAGASPTASTPTSGYAPTYFPGTASAGDAQKITLMPGQENASVDFALVPVRLSRISGVVLGSDGKPTAGAMVNVMPANRNEPMLFSGASATRTNQDGAFTLSGVAPGEYTLQANAMQVMTSSEGGNTMMFRVTGGAGGSDSEFGSVPISVGGDDITNLVLVTAKGATVLGHVSFEDGAKPSSFGGLRISAMSADADGPTVLRGGPSSGQVKPDGTFELQGLGGTRLIRAMAPPPGWTVKAVRLNGVDVTDNGIEFKSGQNVEGLEVVLTAKATNVVGSVTGADGAPVKDYTIVIFADNEDLWRLPSTRWITGRRPDQDGRFKVEGLPPGAYHAVAVEYIPQGEWGDPEVLARLKGKGKGFTLGEGATETLDLKLVSAF
jgi:protocatechuate 3,4-dioxygenase beta subunit